MKTGYYIRYVPITDEWSYYFYDGVFLLYLGHPLRCKDFDIEWLGSGFEKPSRRYGFSYVCNEVFE